MEQVKDALTELFEKYRYWELFPTIVYSEIEKDQGNKYRSCLNASYLATDALIHFQRTPRPKSVGKCYLLIYGALQAFIIQQDALQHLHSLFIEPKRKFKEAGTAWMKLRELRDVVAGHPASQQSITGIVGFGEDWGVHTFHASGQREPVYVHSYILSLLPQYKVELLETIRVIGDGIETWIDRKSEEHSWLKKHLAGKTGNR